MDSSHARRLIVPFFSLILFACQQGDPAAALAHATLTLAPPAAIAAPIGLAGKSPRASTTPARASQAPVVRLGGNVGANSGSEIQGQVFGEVGAQDTPLPGAQVRTSDGRSTTTGADGRFILGGSPPGDGVYVVSHPGYATSAVAGLTDAAVSLHLQPLATVLPGSALAPNGLLSVTGVVQDSQGNPLGGIMVVLADSRGYAGNPVVSGPDGTFSVAFDTPGQSLVNGTLLAADTHGHWLGLASDLQGAGPTVSLAPLRLTATTHALALQVDSSAIGLPAQSGVELVADDGTSLGLFERQGAYDLAPIAGAHYDLHAEAADASKGISSSVYRDSLAIDFGAASSTIDESLLPPPAVSGTPSLQPDTMLTWAPVAGAEGYQVTLGGEQDQGYLWEAFTPEDALKLFDVAPAPGAYDLTITAWDQPELSSRTVAEARPRALRVLPLDGGYRKASRHLSLSL